MEKVGGLSRNHLPKEKVESGAFEWIKVA